jgi:hypothetical protein
MLDHREFLYSEDVTTCRGCAFSKLLLVALSWGQHVPTSCLSVKEYIRPVDLECLSQFSPGSCREILIHVGKEAEEILRAVESRTCKYARLTVRNSTQTS